MESKIKKILYQGMPLICLVDLVKKETKKRLALAQEGLQKEIEKYPEVSATLGNAFAEFQILLATHDYPDTMACDMITKNINPVLNVFQHMMARQAEIVAYRQLLEKLDNFSGFKEFVNIFKPVDSAGSFFERAVIQNINKYYSKIINGVLNQAQCELKKIKEQEREKGIEYLEKMEKEGEVSNS